MQYSVATEPLKCFSSVPKCSIKSVPESIQAGTKYIKAFQTTRSSTWLSLCFDIRAYICCLALIFLLFLNFFWFSSRGVTWWQNATAVNGSPARVPAWVTVGYVGSGTGEHTFPGQLEAQGCREPSAAWVTLDPRISRSRQRKTLRDSGEAGSGALVLNAGLHHVLMHNYTSQHSSAMWPGTETEGETRNLSTPSFSFITGSFGFVFWSVSSDLIFFVCDEWPDFLVSAKEKNLFRVRFKQKYTSVVYSNGGCWCSWFSIDVLGWCSWFPDKINFLISILKWIIHFTAGALLVCSPCDLCLYRSPPIVQKS